MKNYKILLALALCVLVLGSCGVAEKVAYYTKAGVVLEATNPVTIKRYDKDGNSYTTKEVIGVGSLVLSLPDVLGHD